MTLAEAIEKHKVSIDAEFVPFSRSRNKNEKNKSLNWKVTLKQDGREILTTDYSAGIAHCPSYAFRMTLSNAERVERECETGFDWKDKALLPKVADFVASLFMDADALNYGSFEEWAEDSGYDSDSRKAEQVYKACLAIALKLRNGLTNETFEDLEEAAQDY